MPRSRGLEAVRGAIGGVGAAAGAYALAGASFGPLGAGIGAGIGLLTGLFGGGETEEDVRQQRKAELMKKIAQFRLEGTQRLLTATRGQVQNARQAAAERAAAEGRSGQVESFIAPVEGRVARAGNESLARFQTASDQQALGVEEDFSNRPIQLDPSITDYLTTIGGAGLQYAQNKEYLDTMKSMYASPKTGGTTVTTGMPSETPGAGGPSGRMDEYLNIGQQLYGGERPKKRKKSGFNMELK